MSRLNTLVLDTSVLPKRPKVSDVQNFMNNKLKLDMTTVRRIQVHNLKNIVRLGMTSLEAAEQVASKHHLKHFMECDETQVPVPIYVESAAVDVRVFDLPENFSDETIKTFFSKYGEIISIRDEVWRSFFPGFKNGVKVLKMKLAHPIPSIVTIDDESTLVEYKNQPKRAAQQKQKGCIEPQQTTSSQSTTGKKANNQQQLNAASEWPSLPPPTVPSNSNDTSSQNRKTKGALSLSKRQRSEEETNDNTQLQKKTCTDDTDGSMTTQPENDVILSDEEIDRVVKEITIRIRNLEEKEEAFNRKNKF